MTSVYRQHAAVFANDLVVPPHTWYEIRSRPGLQRDGRDVERTLWWDGGVVFFVEQADCGISPDDE